MWICTNVDFHKCEIPQFSNYAKDPSNLFGYQRHENDKNIQNDEGTSSEGSGVDASKSAKAQENGITTSQSQPMGPTGKTATLVTPSVRAELFLTAVSTRKPTITPGTTLRSFPTSMVSQRTASMAKASNTLISAKGTPG